MRGLVAMGRGRAIVRARLCSREVGRRVGGGGGKQADLLDWEAVATRCELPHLRGAEPGNMRGRVDIVEAEGDEGGLVSGARWRPDRAFLVEMVGVAPGRAGVEVVALVVARADFSVPWASIVE